MAESKKIYFVRHGSPERLESQFVGRVDSPLTEKGKTEAARTGRWFKEQGFSGLIYSSPLSRAYNTAKIIIDEIQNSNKSFEREIKVVDKLAECDFGAVDGLTMSELKTRYPKETATWYGDPFNNCFPEGESFADCGRRFEEAVKQILEENKDNNSEILVAAHMCVIQSYLILAGLREFGEDFVKSPIPCASITSVVYGPDGRMNVEKWGWLPD